MLVNEIFKSIQGESSYSGFPCTFIRTSGCNLQCSYCDTIYASHTGQDLSVDEIMETVRKNKVKLVEITGGEPLLDEDTPLLAEKLLQENFTVLVETNGSLDIRILPAGTVKIMDIKCPGSNMSHKMHWQNISYLTKKDEVKFVVIDRLDYEWALEKIIKYDLHKRVNILFSCVFAKLEPQKLVEWILKDNLNVRFQLQIHKYIWHPDKRGV